MMIGSKQRKEAIDVTDKVAEAVRAQDFEPTGCHVFVTSVSAGLATVALDPVEDIAAASIFEIALQELSPTSAIDTSRHPTPLPDHAVVSMLGSSLWVPIEERKLLLGEGQRLVLIDLFGPRRMELIVVCS